MTWPLGLLSRPREHDAVYVAHNVPGSVDAGARQAAWVEVRNTGSKVWLRDEPSGRRVDLAVFVDGALAAGGRLPRDVGPAESALVALEWTAPEKAGRHRIAFDLVEQNVAYFSRRGVRPLEVPFRVVARPPEDADALSRRALDQNFSFFWPAQGVVRGRDGTPYPVFADKAEGCTVTDVSGRTYVDWVMGWGSAFLGYAHPAVAGAVRRALESAPVLTLTHRLEMEVTALLCETVPSAEAVVFGKNGSDVCTVAARLARIATGRRTILVSGYHGWQDWYLAAGGFAAPEAVPPDPSAVVPFRPNDLAHLEELLERHRGRVAAVMLEPAAAVCGVDGPVLDADPSFLAQVAARTREEGALLVFDEVFTGFRYPGGSVQAHTGVVPDLTCLGKALGGGHPLSALVGRRSIFRGLERAYYGPTFKGEAHSFAAARAALGVYLTRDVPSEVWAVGERLRDGIEARLRSRGIDASVSGPPIRMVPSFHEADPERRTALRTLLQQELLRAGVLTYRGVMIPSAAHGEEALGTTLRAFDAALDTVAAAARGPSLAPFLEIPPIR